MKRLTCVCVLAGMVGMFGGDAMAGGALRGNLMEVHSCEVYVGPCMANSEELYEGRYLLRVWDFTGGSFGGTDLTGVQMAVLQRSSENLAKAGARTGDAVVYLPEAATPAQRAALVGWLKSAQGELQPETVSTRVVPLRYARSEQGQEFSAGDFISVKTVVEECEAQGCGQTLWYEPRSAMNFFTVATTRASQVSEPRLKLRWNEGTRRNVFVGRFGEVELAANRYVTPSEFCGPMGGLF